MSILDLRHLENRLLEERREALADIRRASSVAAKGERQTSGELSRVPVHMADAGSDTQEAEKDFRSADRESDRIARIDASLRLLRADPEAFQKCEKCGREIGPERMEILPWARTCATCAGDSAPNEAKP